MIDAVVLAGGVDKGDIAAELGVVHRPLLEVGGQSIIERVLAALRGASEIGKVVLVAPPPVQAAASEEAVDARVAASDSYIDNMARGVEATDPGSDHLLIVTGDLPLITAAAIDDLVRQSLASRAALCYAIIPKEASERQFPGSRRTYVRFREGYLHRWQRHRSHVRLHRAAPPSSRPPLRGTEESAQDGLAARGQIRLRAAHSPAHIASRRSSRQRHTWRPGRRHHQRLPGARIRCGQTRRPLPFSPRRRLLRLTSLSRPQRFRTHQKSLSEACAGATWVARGAPCGEARCAPLDPGKEPEVVVCERAVGQQTVEVVQHAAVSGKDRPRVLDTRPALQLRLG